MKKNFKQKYRSLIKLHLLKYQIYKNNLNTSFNNVSIELKQALKIIYLYNKKKKKILFIGFPFNTKLQNQLQHSFMSKIDLKKKLQTSNLVLSDTETKEPNLIVINATSKADTSVVRELKKFNIPLILFGTFDETLTFKSYKVNIFLDKNYIKKFCWFLIFSILTKN